MLSYESCYVRYDAGAHWELGLKVWVLEGEQKYNSDSANVMN